MSRIAAAKNRAPDIAPTEHVRASTPAPRLARGATLPDFARGAPRLHAEPRLIGYSSDGPNSTRPFKASEIFAARKHRARIFGRSMFGEPAWDILLALYVGDGHRRMIFSEVVQLTGMSVTTFLRWVNYLEQAQMVVLTRHRTDRRKIILELAEEGCARMVAYLDDISNGSALPD